jgi:hypothetical protein
VIRNHREALLEHLDVDDPIPTGSLADIRDWMDRYASVVSKQLNPEADEPEANA